MKRWKIRLPHLKLRLKLPHLTRKQWLLIGGGATGLVIVLFLWATFAPQRLAYNYALEATCVSSPRFLPDLSSMSGDSTFRMHRPARVSIGGVTIFSSELCADNRAAPSAEQSYAYRERLLGAGFLSRKITITTSAFAELANRTAEKQSVPPDAPLKLNLTEADKTFDYAVVSGATVSVCDRQGETLRCNLTPLGLTYSQTYDIAVVRMYAQQRVSTLNTVPVQTITPTALTGMSIPPGGIVQDKPSQIVLTTDKPIKSLGVVQLVAKQGGGKETIMPSSASFTDNQITVKIGQELPRKVSFELRLASVEATDGSGLTTKSYALPFGTSGGPRVKNANIAGRNVALGQTVTVTFDQMLLPSQPIHKNVAIKINGTPATATLSISANKLNIAPTNPLPLCAPFTITVDNGIQSEFGIAGDSAWSIKSRVICYTTFSVGSSVQGRALTAYRFGSGQDMIIYMGAMHGSEANSKNTMTEWFNELNTYPERIPAHRSIVIIPSVNPDGVAAGTRFNARGVDLNRNFPANDWKSVVATPGSPATPAGGPAPLSEPESQAIASFIRQNSPRLVMSFHSKAAVVEANEAGDSLSVAAGYASRSRYRAVPKSQSAHVFQYDTTGAMEDWMRDKLGRPAIVVELATNSSSEFGRNRDALWYTIGL